MRVGEGGGIADIADIEASSPRAESKIPETWKKVDKGKPSGVWRNVGWKQCWSDERRVAASNMLGLVFEIRSDSRPTFTFSRAETPDMPADEIRRGARRVKSKRAELKLKSRTAQGTR